MKNIKKKALWLALTLIEYALIISFGTLFAYCWISSGYSEFVCGMITVFFLFGHIALGDDLKEKIMMKVFKAKEVQVNI